MASDNEIMESSGNVFADLGISKPTEALAKAKLAMRIGDIIKKRKLTQAKAAKILGIDQARVSALTRGQLRGFSTDRLFRLLNALDHDVEIIIRAKPKSRGQAHVHVVTR